MTRTGKFSVLVAAGLLPAAMAGAQAPAPAALLATAPGVATAAGAAAALPPGHPEDGATIFKKCAACHQIGPTAKIAVGPVLNGVVGRPAGTYPGYNYSEANKSSGAAGLIWTEDNLAAYLPAPKMFMPGTKMSFPGLTMPQDVADVIAYLKQYDAMGNKTGS